MLWGRDEELATVAELCAGARDGHGGALVIRGEAGIGKTALTEEAARRCGMRVFRAVGVESESDLPFAGLHALLASQTDQIAALPDAQAAALSAALGLADKQTDRFRVGLALLTLLTDLAGNEPVLCLIDDAHWLDRSSIEAILFAARRLRAEPVAIILTVREDLAPRLETPGLPELWLAGLDTQAATELMRHHRTELTAAAREPILAAARGNPLALRELPSDPVAEPARRHPLLHSFAARLACLPENTLTLLALAAVDDTGESQATLSAAGRLGADITDADPAVALELARVDQGRIVLRHPMIRTAIHDYVPLSTRVAAHRALADVLNAETDSDRRAWHLAAITFQPDDAVASELERTAQRARSRGGFASEFAATRRAAALSVDESNRGRRLRIAARAAIDAGQLEDARHVAEQAAETTTDGEQRARIQAVQATIAEENRRPRQAHDLLVDASALTTDAPTAADLLFRAVDTAITAGDLDAVRRDAALARQTEGAEAASLLARAALGYASAEVADGLAAVRELIARLPPSRLPWRQRPLTLSWQLLLGDDKAMLDTAETLAAQGRRQGAIGALPWVLSGLARAQWNTGRPHDARASVAEGTWLATETGQRLSADYLFSIAADLAGIDGDTVSAAAGGVSSVLTDCAHSLREVGRGDYERVWKRRDVLTDPSYRMFTFAALPDLIEAAAHLGRGDQVAATHDWFTVWADHTGQYWARAVSQRCQALLTSSEDHYVQAMELHDRDTVRPFERARTALSYGAWLRRHRGPRAAQPVLRSAVETFESLCAKQWIERSRAELRAAGESRVPASDTPLGRLTLQELQVVRLAAAGLSNRDIGDRLFLSPRTVGYHLSNAYPKLGVASRRELTRLDLRD